MRAADKRRIADMEAAEVVRQEKLAAAEKKRAEEWKQVGGHYHCPTLFCC